MESEIFLLRDRIKLKTTQSRVVFLPSSRDRSKRHYVEITNSIESCGILSLKTRSHSHNLMPGDSVLLKYSMGKWYKKTNSGKSLSCKSLPSTPIINDTNRQTDKQIKRLAEDTDNKLKVFGEDTDSKLGKIQENINTQLLEIKDTDRKLCGLAEDTDRKLCGLAEDTDRKLCGLAEDTDRKLCGLAEDTDRKLNGLAEDTDRKLCVLAEDTDRKTTEQLSKIQENMRNQFLEIKESIAVCHNDRDKISEEINGITDKINKINCNVLDIASSVECVEDFSLEINNKINNTNIKEVNSDTKIIHKLYTQSEHHEINENTKYVTITAVGGGGAGSNSCSRQKCSGPGGGSGYCISNTIAVANYNDANPSKPKESFSIIIGTGGKCVNKSGYMCENGLPTIVTNSDKSITIYAAGGVSGKPMHCGGRGMYGGGGTNSTGVGYGSVSDGDYYIKGYAGSGGGNTIHEGSRAGSGGLDVLVNDIISYGGGGGGSAPGPLTGFGGNGGSMSTNPRGCDGTMGAGGGGSALLIKEEDDDITIESIEGGSGGDGYVIITEYF